MQIIYISVTDKDKNSQLIIDGLLYLLSDLFRIVNKENSPIDIMENENLEVYQDVNSNNQNDVVENESPPVEEVGGSSSSQSLDTKGT